MERKRGEGEGERWRRGGKKEHGQRGIIGRRCHKYYFCRDKNFDVTNPCL